MAESRVVITADVEQAVREINRFRAEASGSMRQISAMGEKLAGVLQSLGLAIGVSQIVQLSDEYAKYTAQLRLATVSTQEYAKAYADVKRIATVAQADLAGTGTLYARIANGTRELGIAQKQVADITETVNLSLKVSGATATETASAQLQLSQAFASGTLRGEEFNAVNEAAPRLMIALADGMGKPVGALKQMASDGLITSKIMAEVLPKALERLRVEAAQIQTIGGAFTVLKSNLMEFVGIQSNASGAVSVLTSAIGLLANNFTLIGGAIATLVAAKMGTWLTGWVTQALAASAANRALATSTLALAVTSAESAAATAAAKMVEARAAASATFASMSLANARVAELRAAIAVVDADVALAIATNGLIPALARATALSEAHAIAMSAEAAAAARATVTAGTVTVALDAQAAATTLATRAMVALNGVMSFFGGPIGFVITLLGAAAMAWSHYSSKADQANKDTVESFEEAHKRIIAGLDKEIEKNENLLALKNKGMTTQQAEKNLPITAQIDAAQKKLDALNKPIGQFVSGNGKDVFAARLDLMNQIDELQKKMGKREEIGAAVAKQTIAERVAAFNKENATKQEKMKAELKGIEDLKGKTAEYGSMVQRIRDKYADKSADSAAASAAKSDLGASLATIKYGIEVDKAMRGEGLAAVAELNRQGLASDAQYYIAKYNDALAAGTDIARVKDAEIAELVDYNNKSAAEEIATKGKIDKIRAERNEALRASLVAANQLRAQYVYDSDAPARAAQAAADAQVAALNTEVIALQAQYDAYGKLPAAITAAAIAKQQAHVAALEANEGSEAEIANANRLIVALQTKAALQSKVDTQDTGSSVAKAKELLDILTAVDAATKSAADGMAASFGKVGSAIGGLTTALSGYAVQQQAIAAQLATVKADPKSSADKISKAEIAAANASAQAKIKSYGDMAGAAKGFFKEHTTGYKVMEGAEKAYRAVEMAMAIQTMLTKSGLITAFTGLFVASKATETTIDGATTAKSVVNSGIRAAADGVAAFAKTLASIPFPFNVAAGAAVIALLAGAGVAIAGGGGGGVDVSKQRQETQGTGSVFGDSTAKSDSIARSLELAAANSSIELTHTAGMLASLRNIESSLGGLGNLLIRNAGLTGATAEDSAGAAQRFTSSTMGTLVLGGPFAVVLDKLLGGFASKTLGKIAGSIFGGKVSVQDTGLVTSEGTIGSVLRDGITASQYTDTKKSGGMFRSDKYRTNLAALGPEADDQIAKVLLNMSAGVTEAGKLLGLGGLEFTKALESFPISLKISLKGLKGDEIQRELEAGFSKLGDKIAESAVGGLTSFSEVGEGYLETLTRIAVNYANLDSILASTGTTFGATGMSSIAARERLLELAGGIDELASKSTTFADSFLTEAERLAPVQKYVTEQLAAMGLAGIDTRDKFKATVLGLANSGALATEAGAKQYAGLLDLADAFAKTHAATEDLTKSEQAIADERKDLQQQLNEQTMTSVQLMALQRAGIADSNKALFDQIQAAKAVASAKDVLASAYDKESAALKTAAERMRAFQASTLSFADSLKLGSLSTLNPAEKAQEAQRQYEATLAKAMKGDSAAQSAINAAATAYLTADQVIKSSTDAYAADAARVQADLAALAAIAGGQATDAEKQLAALDKQVGALIDINTSIKDGALTVAQAIANLAGLGYTGLAGVDGSHAGGLARVPFDGYRAELHRDEVVVDAPAAAAMRRYFGGAPSQGGNTDALVAEIKALRDEVKGLRADQAQQTGDIISKNYDATDRAAGKAADGAKDAAKTTVWAQQSKAVLA